MSIGWSLFGVVVLIVAWVWFDRPRHTRTEEKNRKVIEQVLRHMDRRIKSIPDQLEDILRDVKDRNVR